MRYYIFKTNKKELTEVSLGVSVFENRPSISVSVPMELIQMDKTCFVLKNTVTGKELMFLGTENDLVGEKAFDYFREMSMGQVTGNALKIIKNEKDYIALIPEECGLQLKPYCVAI